MKKENIAAQLYCFRDYIKTVEQVDETLKKLSAIGYKSVQLTSALPQEISLAEVLALLAKHDIKAVSTHERSNSIFDETEKTISKLHTLGVTHTAYPWLHIVPESYDETVEFAHKLNDLALRFKAEGITLSYHNHAKEFIKFNGMTMLEIIYANAPDLAAEIDTFWVHKGGQNPESWVRRVAGRMEYLHIKDYGMDAKGDNPVMKPIGGGNLDWANIIKAAEETGVKYFIVEHDADVTDPFASFEASFKYLIENFAE